MQNQRTVTRLLHECRDGRDPAEAMDALMPLVYDDLKRVARQQLNRLRPGQTLNTTALVNDSYAKLERSSSLDWNDRQHFYAVAARAMRQIIIDHARSMKAGKNRGTRVVVDLENLPDNPAQRADQLIFVDQMLERLEAINPDLVRVVECKFYAGFTHTEICDVLGISRRTVQRRWNQACAWMQQWATEHRPEPDQAL